MFFYELINYISKFNTKFGIYFSSSKAFLFCIHLIILMGFVHLHWLLSREKVAWDECIGKIRSAYLRKVNQNEELNELQQHNYAPLINHLIDLNFKETHRNLFERWIIFSDYIQISLNKYWCYWWRLVLFSLLLLPFDLISSHLLFFYAFFLINKQIKLRNGLERTQRCLLLPGYDDSIC